MRCTYLLMLGLTVSLVSGCANGDKCRIPLLQRLSGRMIFKQRASEGEIYSPGSRIASESSSCDCGTDGEIWSNINEIESGQLEVSPLSEEVAQPTIDWPIEPKEASGDDEILEIDSLEIDSLESDSLEIESLKIPKPPSLNRETNEQLEFDGADVPDDSKQGYYIPSHSSESGRSAPWVTKSDALDLGTDSIANPNSRDPDLIEPAPIKPLREYQFTGNRPDSDPLEPGRVKSRFESDFETGDPAAPALERDADGQTSILKHTPRRIQAQPISTSNSPNQSGFDQTRPAHEGGLPYKPGDSRQEKLPAKSDLPITPIVLRAYPVDNHVINDRRIADARDVDAYGLPLVNRVRLRVLPSMEKQNQNGSPGYSATGDAPFEEPAISNRILNAEPVPKNQLFPVNGPNDAFNSATSYQVPMDNDARVLTELAGAVDCGLVDSDQFYANSDLARTNGQGNRFNSGPILQAKPAEGDGAYLQASGSLRATNPNKPFQILRMRAITAEDRQLQIPPIVSIRSVMAPVIVRGVHPDANLPLVGKDPTRIQNQGRPVFDTERLESSIRGLSSRPGNRSSDTHSTLDR